MTWCLTTEVIESTDAVELIKTLRLVLVDLTGTSELETLMTECGR